jgi:hypothetical protein
VIVRGRSCFGWRAPLVSRPERNVEWWITSNSPSKCGYSLRMVLKQCGQLVMMRRTPADLNVSINACACVW